MIVERPIGVEVSRTNQTIQVLDPFDRSHPYVRWRKQHYYTGNKKPVIILSAVHRTALPGRCDSETCATDGSTSVRVRSAGRPAGAGGGGLLDAALPVLLPGGLTAAAGSDRPEPFGRPAAVDFV